MLPSQGQFVRRPVGPPRNYYAAGYPPHQYHQQQAQQAYQVAPASTTPIPPKGAESRAQKQVGANFLPSIVNEAYHNVLEQVVTAMSYKIGFDDVEESALETLMLLFHSLIKRIGEQSRLACEVTGRTIVSPGDVWFALVNMGIKVNELPQFLADQEGIEFTVHPPEITPVDSKTQTLRIGKPRPHPNYVFEWLPQLPDPHTYIKTEITDEPDLTYEKVRDAISQKKRNGVTSLSNYMVRSYPSLCLFQSLEDIIHNQVRETFKRESRDKRMQEAFVAFRDLLQTAEIDEVKNVQQMLFQKGLINQHDLQSGAEVVCMCSDGSLIDQNGERVHLSDTALVDLEERDRVSKSTTRISYCAEGAESLRYHWNMDEMLDELIELDSCTMDFSEEKQTNELKYLQEKTTFEYIPEWCHVLVPSFEHRAYLQVVSNDLKAEEESKKEKEKEKEKENGNEETQKVKEEEITHENLYLCPPIRDDVELELMETVVESNSEETMQE